MQLLKTITDRPNVGHIKTLLSSVGFNKAVAELGFGGDDIGEDDAVFAISHSGEILTTTNMVSDLGCPKADIIRSHAWEHNELPGWVALVRNEVILLHEVEEEDFPF